MKILVTGASGLVGSAIVQTARAADHDVVGTSRTAPQAFLPDDSLSWIPADLTDSGAVSRLLKAARPELIINCAAVSEAVEVNRDPARAASLNARLPAILAAAANSEGYRWIHLSTDMVFDGAASEAYGPSSSPCPYGAYGVQKLEGERGALDSNPHAGAVVRITIVNGNSPNRTRSLHEKLLRAIASGNRPNLFVDEFRQPVSARSVALACLRLGQKERFQGIYHWAGRDILSRHEIGIRLLRRFGLPPEAIAPARRPEEYPPRPARLAFDSTRLQEEVGIEPESFDAQLDDLEAPLPS